MENETENIDSLNDEMVEETTLTVEDYNKLLKEKEELEEKNKKLYARVKQSSEKKTVLDTPNPQIVNELARLKLQVEHGIKDPEAIDFIMKNGGEKALDNQYIKKTIETMQEQKRAEEAVVSEDSSKSEFEKKYTPDELRNMSAEDLEKILPRN